LSISRRGVPALRNIIEENGYICKIELKYEIFADNKVRNKKEIVLEN
jgi:hypothetical protein